MKKTKIKEINKKFVLVGDGYCGKSTLIAAFYNRQFVEKYTPTIFDTFTVTTDIYKKNVDKINLEICDSAGQEEFSRVRPLSYPEVDAIILCFSVDSRESSQNLLELWLPEIRHYCTSKVPILLVGCKIDLRVNRTPTKLNRHLILKQEHLNNLNRINSLSNQHNSLNLPVNYGLFKALYCCRHRRACTCYHSRICSTDCSNNSLKRKPSNLSNSSNCLLSTPPKPSHQSNSNRTETNKNTIIRCNRLLLQQQSPIRNSTNTEDSFCSSDNDIEESQSNTMSNSSYSLINDLNSHDTYNNSIYRHNQSMLNTLMHQRIEQQYSNSLNSSESDESEITDNQDDQQINQITNDLIDSNLIENHPTHLTTSSINDHYDLSSINDHHQLPSTIEETKNPSFLLKNFKLHNRSRLFRGYKNFVNSSIDTSRSFKLNKIDDLETSNKKSTTSLRDRKLFKSSSLKQKLTTFLSGSSNLNGNCKNSIYPTKSEKKLTISNLFNANRKSSSSSSLPFSLINKTDQNEPPTTPTINSPYITTEEGLKLCQQIGAQAYVECSSKLNINVDEVFKTALKLSIKHPLRFHQLDMCSLS